MAEKITLKSQSPYFDDFDPAKDFVQVLFRPGYPVQARELTTLQSFLHEQVGRIGGNFYKEGDLVKSAELTYHRDVCELILTSSGNTSFPSSAAISSAVLSNIATLEGKVITNASGTVKARVINSPTVNDKTKFVGNLYIQYLTEATFDSDGGYIYANTTDNPESTQLYYNTYSTKNSASLASIAEGLFFVQNNFIKVQKQTILLSNTTHKPNVNVGLAFEEEIITQNDDPSLYDNARGSSNEGAPGAHRLKYSLKLTKKALTDPVDSNFYRIATFINGVKQEQPKAVDAYLQNILEILARRTYDESGDYTIRPFKHDLNEGDSENQFLLTVGPSKAYVKGWEIDKTSPTYVYMDRGLNNTKLTQNYSLPVVGTTSVTIDTIDPAFSLTGAYQKLKLKNSSGTVIGVARGWAVKDEFKKGVANTKLYLFDIKMFSIVQFTDVGYAATLTTGNDLYSLKTRGTVYTVEGSAGVSNAVAVINTTGKFRANQTVGSSVLGTESTIADVINYQLSDVTRVEDGSNNNANVVSNSVENETSSLIVDSGKHIKTLFTSTEGGVSSINNDFEVLSASGGIGYTLLTTDSRNGNYSSYTVRGKGSITKTLKFAYLKIGNTTTRTGVNYGWHAKDKEISLFYPDVHRVYRINESTDASFDNGRFARLTIATAGVIPQGSIVTGSTSGTKAIVALQNAGAGQISLSSSSSYHVTRTGTGLTNSIEVIFTRGQSFTTNETLIVEVPSGEDQYNYQVTYSGVTAAVGSEVTGSFALDNGQRKEYYDIGRLVRKENVPAPTKDLVVFFSYFEADPTTANYYSADSYANENFMKVDPRYYGETREIKPKLKDDGLDLRNVIDFRLRTQTVSSVSNSPFNFAYRSFINQERVVPSSKFTSGIYEYLGRIDLVSLEKTGEIITIEGVPSTNPNKPQASVDGMPLFWVTVPPAVRYPADEVYVEIVDNKRYTMRDIGILDRRINRLEETVALTMLESQALHDDINGRTKSGFVVDDFSLAKDNPNSPSDPTHPEYNASVDIINRHLIPSQTSGVPVTMIQSSFLNGSSFFENYYLNAFTEEAFSTQLDATTSQLINPFATWVFNGDVTITPDEDNWRIRRDEYFTELYGELRPFEGSAEDFQRFARITTASPGGISTTLQEWTGSPWSTTDSASTVSGRTTTTTNTTTTFQTQRTTTTVNFDSPRVVAGTTPITTQTGTRVIENPQDYFMRSLTVTFAADNLRPNTDHTATFGNRTVIANVKTNNEGSATGSFTIPAQTFKAGVQNFELKDTDTVGGLSFGAAAFRSIGHLDTFRTTAQTVDRTVTVTSATAVRGRNVTTTSQTEQENDDPRPDPPGQRGVDWDPIAQMFMLPQDKFGNETSIVTSLDLWFSKVDLRPTMNKVKVEIRKSINGYPGGNAEIIGTSGWITLSAANEVKSITSTNAKNFKFKEPVVLRGDAEYAIVVKSPSDVMSVYVAEIGQPLIDGSGIHADQPFVGGYFGSFFVSQNATTWNAEQSKDLTYRLYRAKFDRGSSATLTLINKNEDAEYHLGDIGAYNQGLAMETFENSKYVRVYHPNHGFHYQNAKVTISGVENKVYNGIDDSDLNGIHDVVQPTLNTYMFKTKTAATSSGKINTGIWTTFATQDIMYDSLLTNFMITKEESDEVKMKAKTTITSPISLVISDSDKITNDAILVPYADATTDYEVDRLIEFAEPRIVRSKTNANTNDLTITLTLSSGTSYTSPIIKKGSNLNPIAFRNLTGYLLKDSDIESLTVRDVSQNASDDSEFMFVSYLQGIQSETEHSSYVTKQIDLEIPADGFSVFFDAIMKPDTEIIGAYKVRQLGDDTPFSEIEWQDLPYAQQVTEANYGEFSSAGTRLPIQMRIQTPFEFTSFKFRFRLKTKNEAYIPKLSELRIICDI